MTFFVKKIFKYFLSHSSKKQVGEEVYHHDAAEDGIQNLETKMGLKLIIKKKHFDLLEAHPYAAEEKKTRIDAWVVIDSRDIREGKLECDEKKKSICFIPL